MNYSMKNFLEPKSVAIIGVSSHKEKIGGKLMNNLLKGKFPGEIYPVNPKGGQIEGLQVYKSLGEIPNPVDLVLIAVKAPFVYAAMEDCVRKEVGGVCIISSGFSEVGAVEEEKRVVQLARARGIRVLGPNIFGVFSAKSSFNATFGPEDIPKGNLAIVTQSGALGIAMIGKSAVEAMGLSTIVSIGNKADISEYEVLQYLKEDDSTRVVLMYLEGIQQGQQTIQELREICKKKPVVVIKAGRSEQGAQAAASHTGSMAGDDAVFSSVMKQCGVLRASSVQEAFYWCKFLCNTPLPHGDKTLILTNGGGVGVITADACEDYAINLVTMPLQSIFGDLVPSFGSLRNPVDLTAQAGSTEYLQALYRALKTNGIDAVLALYCEALITGEELIQITTETTSLAQKLRKPLLFALYGGEEIEEAINPLRRSGMPVYADVSSMASCLGALYSYQRYTGRKITPMSATVDVEAVKKIITQAEKEERTFLLSEEGSHVLKALRIPTPRSAVIRSEEELVKQAEEIETSVVLKIVSPDILHKSDVGGVIINLRGRNDILKGYRRMMRDVKEHLPEARIHGVEISEMAEAGTEVIIGAKWDPSFGPIVMFGSGGVLVEVFGDIAFRSFPLSREEMVSMMEETKASRILSGVRGASMKDRDAVMQCILHLGTLLSQVSQITDIEINPLFVYEQGVKAVDVRVLLRKTS